MDTNLWKMSALDLASAIKHKNVSSREVVQAHLDRISEINGKANAVTVVYAEQALALADGADRAVASDADLGPLHGVPITLKESVDLKDTVATRGVPAFKDIVSPEDEICVERLRAAGAIPFARTNMPDFGLRWHTDNDIFGATINPWDSSLTPGGSSGGEAVALATGMSPLGIGGDYGGSVRLPSLCNGTTALKASSGRIPSLPGYHPKGRAAPALTSQLFSVRGPMARHVRDLRVALEVMGGYDPRDSRTLIPSRAGKPQRADLKIAVTLDPAGCGVDAAVLAGLQLAAAVLAEQGYQVEETDPPDVRRAAELYTILLSAEVEQMHLPVMEDAASQGTLQFLSLHGEAFRAEISKGDAVSLPEYLQALAFRKVVADDWAMFFSRYDLILGPVMTIPPFKAGEDIGDTRAVRRISEALHLTKVVNFLGLPSAAVPVQILNGIPHGVQIIGERFQDEVCLDAAEVLEKELGVFTPIEPR